MASSTPHPITTSEFWAATGERAIATACETAIPIVPANLLGGIDVAWAVGIVASATVLSVLKSLYAGTKGSGSPSLTDAEVLPEAGR